MNKREKTCENWTQTLALANHTYGMLRFQQFTNFIFGNLKKLQQKFGNVINTF